MHETPIATTGTTAFDVADYLDTPEAAAAYLALALEDGDATEFRRALGVVARSRSMTAVARDAGLSREGLYKALSEEGNPSLDTVFRALGALQIRLTAVPVAAPDAA
ncbi:putative addiction module antidote protein [Methylobacterium sp. WL69]|uniref:addiction module antidote protein n=1 Tax=Methylobacterium sp. WL69 TaxID=2603893 RepID=UPI0011C70773|nr:addiction module antidote protein [Methylobacterium sp. WL69]TXM74350.1 putative addiction module antidote protein [Methylobacterium sp. WL69]